MATSRTTALLIRQYRHFIQNVPSNTKFCTSSRLSTNSSFQPGYTRDPDELFFRDDIQTLLRRITGCNYDKIFQPRRLGTKLQSPKYDLLTQEEIDKLMAEVEQKTETKLQMPPLLNEWKPIDNVLSVNPELQGFDTAKYVFTDISFGIPNRKRMVVVREPDGVLRQASREEKSKMTHIYFPIPGKQLRIPKMFEDQYLQECLKSGEYEFVLDRACAQFDPDDPNYIRVTRKTYDFVDEKRHYETLRSTRHFGPMALHLVLSQRMDDLLCYFVAEEEITAAADLVRVFHKVRSSSFDETSDDYILVQNYIQKDALKKPALELSWDTFLEIDKQRKEISMANKLSN